MQLYIYIQTCYKQFSIFKLVSVAEQAGLNLIFSSTPKTGFLVSRHICHPQNIELTTVYSESENRLMWTLSHKLKLKIILILPGFQGGQFSVTGERLNATELTQEECDMFIQ